MKYRHLSTYLLLIILLSIGCGNDSVPTEETNKSVEIEKSKKRGISYNLVDALDLDTLKSGVSWWYNWYFKTDAPADYYDSYQMEFIPMLWGSNSA